MKNTRLINITAVPDNPVPAEVMEQAIVEIGKAMKRINETRLTRRAIVVLIHHHSKVALGTVELVLNNLDALEDTWLKKPSMADRLYPIKGEK